MPYRKKLIEVALPLKAINEASAREKSIRHGHPSTLHLWWARRPLAACRAVLFASLVDDPDSDPMYAGAGEEIAGAKRAELFNLIEELVQWENSNNPRVINRARAEIARSVAANKVADSIWTNDTVLELHGPGETPAAQGTAIHVPVRDIKNMLAPSQVVNAFLAEHAAPVLDPFCGGGSIPLEAQRLGLRAYASDLNPVPVLITKALIEIPPKFASRSPVNPDWQSTPGAQKQTTVWQGAQGLAEDVRYYGQWMRDEAEKRIGHLYPKVKITKAMAKDRPDLEEYVGHELAVIAWLWARTVECPNPSCRARAPLVRSFWLSSKRGTICYLKPIVDQNNRSVRFAIETKGSPPKHTTDRTGARCLFCGTFIKKGPLREIARRHGLTEVPLAVVAEGPKGRVYFTGEIHPRPIVERPSLPFLEQPMTNDKRWFSPPLYGLPNFADLFTARQLVALTTFSDLVQEARKRVLADAAVIMKSSGTDESNGASAYADAVATYLGFLVDQLSNQGSTLTGWYAGNQQLMMTFSRQALPMVWDYAESNPLCESSGSYHNLFERLLKAFENIPGEGFGSVRQLDASVLEDKARAYLISTDPPYYDNIGYSDLSDYFYVWMRRTLGAIYPILFSTLLTPKAQELIASTHRHGGNRNAAQHFFETGLGKAFGRMHAVLQPDCPLTIYYAFRQTEADDETDDEEAVGPVASTGWETMLAGLITSGFSINGTWPIRTEQPKGMKASTNALASSIVLVCRPRSTEASLATRKQFLTALRQELPDALRSLQHGNIAPVDMAQSAIGPGMAVFTRYRKVIESDGSPMTVRTALGIINLVLDEVLAEQEGDFDSDTRWALAWFEQHGMEEGPFGVAETLSKAKNTAVNGLVEAGVVKARAGKVQLVRRDELPEDWDPTTDRRLTVWEITQHLISTMETKGESEAAALVNRLGGMAETARDLAYRLYSICERNKWADEALSYNALVIAWPELTKLALAHASRGETTTQQAMF